MDMGLPAERTQFFHVPKNWRSHFRPQNCGQKFYGHEDFSDQIGWSQDKASPWKSAQENS